ncbi:restriction endonuclease subunit S [Nitratidesulfovibrio sp. D1]|uniref:restriction endonuclease subunit S n=1 Tax=Nitratidesulfovibrio sp. D1 TaxID=3440151 RepID=UPI003EC129A6
MSFPAYPEYKDSGVEWLGDIPGHWSHNQIKRECYLKGRVGWKGLNSDEYQDSGHAYLVTGTDFSSKFINWDSCYWVDQSRFEDDPFIQLTDGDLLITKDGTIGKLAIVTGLNAPACLNSGIFLLRPLRKIYLTEYMYWILSSKAFSFFCALSSLGSTIQHLYQNTFEQFIFPIPPLSEQSVIVAFLDHETAKIDALISEQETLIALLKEKCQAVISHVVTKGLDPNVPMKDSGVEWLGEVPEHWRVCRLRWAAQSIKAGPFGSAITKDMYTETGFRVYGQEQVIADDFTVGNYYIDIDKHTTLAEYIIFPRDILISCVGTFGKISIFPDDAEAGIINPRLINIRFDYAIIPEYIKYTLTSRAVSTQISMMSRGGTMGVINVGILKNIIIPIPPVEEQRAILNSLSIHHKKIASLVNEAEYAIRLLKERRSALISAAVTGKIDVRGYAPQPEVA